MRESIDTAGFDRSYRRGIVLGLSLAELFIILVFLLLLMMAAYTENIIDIGDENDLMATSANKDKENEQLKKEMDALVVELAAKDKEIEQLKKEMDALVVELAAKDKEIEQLKKERDELAGELSVASTLTDNLKERVQQADEQMEIKDARISDLIAANENKDKEIERHKKERDELADKFEVAKQKAQQSLAAANAAADSLGQISPCWYVVVPARGPNGEDYKRERALYVFDIRISDRSILVKDAKVEKKYPITAQHRRQKAELNFDRSAVNRELRYDEEYDEFTSAFQAFKTAGHGKKIRDRRCAFFVRVWDATHRTNKLGYKRADKIVRNIFHTYQPKDKPWPHQTGSSDGRKIMQIR